MAICAAGAVRMQVSTQRTATGRPSELMDPSHGLTPVGPSEAGRRFTDLFSHPSSACQVPGDERSDARSFIGSTGKRIPSRPRAPSDSPRVITANRWSRPPRSFTMARATNFDMLRGYRPTRCFTYRWT